MIYHLYENKISIDMSGFYLCIIYIYYDLEFQINTPCIDKYINIPIDYSSDRFALILF